ncbi:hypothetical protein B0H13DRAFT_1858393 [Mycena leptocephala]|nr:hypothetical protein B0H13DRAFT_1858393 [Mycena leptocephala]
MRPRAPGSTYIGEEDPRSRAIRIPDYMGPSNQVGEAIAIKEAAEIAPLNTPLRILSDSKYVIEGLTKNLQRWQDEGFFTVLNGDVMELTVAKLRERKAETVLSWVKGHSGDAGNEADLLTGEVIVDTADAALLLPGAKLQAMTQSLAYLQDNPQDKNGQAELQGTVRTASDYYKKHGTRTDCGRGYQRRATTPAQNTEIDETQRRVEEHPLLLVDVNT